MTASRPPFSHVRSLVPDPAAGVVPRPWCHARQRRLAFWPADQPGDRLCPGPDPQAHPWPAGFVCGPCIDRDHR